MSIESSGVDYCSVYLVSKVPRPLSVWLAGTVAPVHNIIIIIIIIYSFDKRLTDRNPDISTRYSK